MNSRDIERIYRHIVLNETKAQSTVPMTPTVEKMWDQIALEVAQMRSEGKAFDIPAEVPEVVIASAVDQDA